MTRHLIAIILLLGTAAANAQQIQVNKDNRTIAITTSDTAKADAEIAQVHIGFNTYAADEKTAYAKASQISNAIIQSLKKSGVSEAAIQSNAQSISEPELNPQDFSAAERAQRRFMVSQSWLVATSAKDAADTLNAAVNAGANNSGDIDWDVKDEDALQAEAAAKALQHARQIAEQMAKGLGASLGSLVYASNETPIANRFRGGGGGGVSETVEVSAQEGKTKPLNIIPQQVTKSATVYAVFALQ